ncbi:tetratricopeptide repeat protein 22-like [Glandiceps talaboti]
MASSSCPSNPPTSAVECGHFHLPLHMLKVNTDRKILTARYESINKQLELESGPICYGLWNVLGVLKFQLGEKLKACDDYFKKVLEEDPCNLNALANLAYVYRVLGMTKKSEIYSRPLQLFFSGESTFSTDERQSVLVRCIAEQAYSMAFDCYDERPQSPPLYQEANFLYECAVRESQNITILKEERYKWKLFMVINHMRVWMINIEEQASYQEHNADQVRLRQLFEKMLNLLQEVLSESSDKSYQSMSWCYIGKSIMKGKSLFRKRSAWVPNFIQQLKLVEYYEDPTCMKCFQKAECFSKIDWKELALIARSLFEGDRLEEALEMVEKSVVSNPDQHTNWYAYFVRAKINFKKYENEQFSKLAATRDAVIRRPDKSLLRQAEMDLDWCMNVMDHRTTNTFLAAKVQLHLGTTVHFKTTDFSSQVEDKDAIMKALELLSAHPEDTHPHKLQLHGNCFMYLEEYSQATDKYTHCINADTNGKYSYLFFALLVSLFHQLRQLQSTDKQSQQKYHDYDYELIRQICDQFQQHYLKYKKSDIQKTLESLENDFAAEFQKVNQYMFRIEGRTLREMLW